MTEDVLRGEALRDEALRTLQILSREFPGQSFTCAELLVHMALPYWKSASLRQELAVLTAAGELVHHARSRHRPQRWHCRQSGR